MLPLIMRFMGSIVTYLILQCEQIWKSIQNVLGAHNVCFMFWIIYYTSRYQARSSDVLPD